MSPSWSSALPWWPLGTSAPEFAVTLTAAYKGYASISVGNIVGSNIFNLGFILGSVAIVRSVNVSPKLVQRDGLLMILSTLFLLLFFRDLVLTFFEGLALGGHPCALPALSLHQKRAARDRRGRCTIAAGNLEGLDFCCPSALQWWYWAVSCWSSLPAPSHAPIGISDWVIGVTIVAAGTSAPEMATSLTAVIKGKHGISAGNLVGSNLFNILGVLGLAGMLKPLTILQSSYYSLILLTAMVIVAIAFMRTGWRISRSEGFLLVLSGMALWAYDFLK